MGAIKKYNPNFWNERYDQEAFVYGEKPNEYLRATLCTIPAGKALFPAEGEGRNAVYAATTGWTVSAVDQSEVGKKKAELLAQKNGVQIDYRLAEVGDADYPEYHFDALILVYAHFHSDQRAEYHRKLGSLLKKGGILILEAFSRHQEENQKRNPGAGGPRDSKMLYSLEEIKADFKDFEFLEAYECMTELNEGDYHQGSASVVRMKARKL